MRHNTIRIEPRDFVRMCGFMPPVNPGSVQHGDTQDVPLPPFMLTDALHPHTTMPLLDVRSPQEYSRAHIPGAVNLPLFNDEQRAQVGLSYKEQGRTAALLDGLEFAGPGLAAMARTALDLCSAHSGGGRDVALYCSRGGMRSASVAWLLETAGLRPHVLAGGYKGFRRLALSITSDPPPFLVLGGTTGSGKTEVLHTLAAMGEQVIDLEGLARHRGSAFGLVSGQVQPTSEHFENLLSMVLLRCTPERPIWLEDECRNIGRVNIPPPFFARLLTSTLVVMETPDEQRFERIMADYGDIPQEMFADGLDRIKKRLGGLAHKQGHECLAAQDYRGLARILFAYYDRAYARQLAERSHAAEIVAANPQEAAAALATLGRQLWAQLRQ